MTLPNAPARRGSAPVYLVGAGPGDPDLMTVKARRLVESAEVLAYDELVPEAIRVLAPRSAISIPVGRRAGGCQHHNERIHPDILLHAWAGRSVVRIKAGDPFIFGRGGEEMEELAAAGIAFEVVPGVSAALAAAASAHIPLTHRDAASSVTFATARLRTDAESPISSISPIASALPVNTSPARGETLVFYMGLGTLDAAMAALVANGWGLRTPAAIVSEASRPEERVAVSTIEHVASDARRLGFTPPAIVIVGDVVARRVASPVARVERPNRDLRGHVSARLGDMGVRPARLAARNLRFTRRFEVPRD